MSDEDIEFDRWMESLNEKAPKEISSPSDDELTPYERRRDMGEGYDDGK
jgi:hypothetical protein